MPPLDSSVSVEVDRELIGVCKQSMLALRQQLKQYIDELHADKHIADINPYIVTAVKEMCECYQSLSEQQKNAFYDGDSAIMSTSQDEPSEIPTLHAAIDYRTSTPVKRSHHERPFECEVSNSYDTSSVVNEAMDAFGLMRQFDDQNTTDPGNSTTTSASVVNLSQHTLSYGGRNIADMLLASPTMVKIEPQSIQEVVESVASNPYINGYGDEFVSTAAVEDKQLCPPSTSRAIIPVVAKRKPGRPRKSSSYNRAAYIRRRLNSGRPVSKRPNSKLCPYCNELFPVFTSTDDKDKYVDHITTVHSNFVTPNESGRHNWTYACPRCPIEVFRLAKFERHYNSVHSKDPMIYNCDQCHRVFKRKDHLSVHIEKKHEPAKNAIV